MRNRQLNIELLRILSMLMVLGLHANFPALGVPTADEVLIPPNVIRVICECFCIVAVNVFVMISGWFGIRPSIRGFLKFMWQVSFFMSILLILQYFLLHEPVTLKNLCSIFGLYGGGGWFVASYIGLFILSPVLNSFLKQNSIQNISIVLVCFFTFEVFFGFTYSVPFISNGYSTFSFIGIYLLAGVLHKIYDKHQLPEASKFAMAYICFSLLNAGAMIIFIKLHLIGLQTIVLRYINPTLILAAACLFMTFIKIDIPENSRWRKIIYFLSSSSFAAYLLHSGTSYAFTLYKSGSLYLFDSYMSIFCLVAIVSYIFGVFLLAVTVDQFRKLVWIKILNVCFKR